MRSLGFKARKPWGLILTLHFPNRYDEVEVSSMDTRVSVSIPGLRHLLSSDPSLKAASGFFRMKVVAGLGVCRGGEGVASDHLPSLSE